MYKQLHWERGSADDIAADECLLEVPNLADLCTSGHLQSQ